MKEPQKELKNDYIIRSELSSFAGKLALRCGSLLAVANAALITTKHIDFNAGKESAFRRFALCADKESGKEPAFRRFALCADKEPGKKHAFRRFALRADKEPGKKPDKEPIKEPGEEPGKEPSEEPRVSIS